MPSNCSQTQGRVPTFPGTVKRLRYQPTELAGWLRPTARKPLRPLWATGIASIQSCGTSTRLQPFVSPRRVVMPLLLPPAPMPTLLKLTAKSFSRNSHPASNVRWPGPNGSATAPAACAAAAVRSFSSAPPPTSSAPAVRHIAATSPADTKTCAHAVARAYDSARMADETNAFTVSCILTAGRTSCNPCCRRPRRRQSGSGGSSRDDARAPCGRREPVSRSPRRACRSRGYSPSPPPRS